MAAEAEQRQRAEAKPRRFAVATATKTSRAALVVGAVLLVALAAVPFYGGRSLIQDLFFVFTMLALAQYWNLLAGYAGLVSVGQQAYVGLGAYGLFALVILWDVDPLVAVLISGLAAGALAVPTAVVVFRLQGAYFAIGTWVVAEVYRLLLAQAKILGGGTGTSFPVDASRSMAGVELIKDLLGVRSSAARDIVLYWAALVLVAGTLGLVYALLRSRRGLALSALRDSELAAASVGVETGRTKLFVYVCAGIGTGFTGALIYLQTARISPDAAFSLLDWTAYVIFIVVIGGIGTIEGPIVGVVVLYFLQDYLATFGTWYLMLLGLLAIAVMLLSPGGIWGLITQRFELQIFPIRRRLTTPKA
jgi:branched-chain amino acid transport system permease protein